MNKSIKNLAPSLLLSTEVVAAAERLDELVSGAIKNDTFVTSDHILKLTEYVDAQAQKDATVAALVPQLNEAISDIMSKARSRKTRSQDVNVAPVPVPAPAPVAVSPLSKMVPMPQQPEAQAKAA